MLAIGSPFFLQSSGEHAMRQVLSLQLQLSEVEISQVEIDLRSRDETPKLLQGLQYIYSMPDTRREVFQILEGMIPLNRKTSSFSS